MAAPIETVSFYVLNLCAPCGCACRYCLLGSCKEAGGVDYDRGKRLARRLIAWEKEGGAFRMRYRPFYYVGYCAEYPQLTDTIAFNRENGWDGARFLQCNGIAVRSREETDRFLRELKAAGVEQVDTTFYGARDFHDDFAARRGDYDFMLLFAARAAALGLRCEPTVPVMKGNLTQLPALLETLEAIPIGSVHCFLPNHRGRGALMEAERITADDYRSLPERVKAALNLSRHKTQAEWLADGPLPECTGRHLVVSLREDNIDMLERMSCEEIVAYVEKLDDDYYAAIPSLNELAAMYGDDTNRKLYQVRDLYWMWQRRYRGEYGVPPRDASDERYCCAIRS